jgi:hypothetical protein
MSSEETSISKETKPSAQTLFGTSRHVADDVFSISERITQHSRPSGADLALSQPFARAVAGERPSGGFARKSPRAHRSWSVRGLPDAKRLNARSSQSVCDFDVDQADKRTQLKSFCRLTRIAGNRRYNHPGRKAVDVLGAAKFCPWIEQRGRAAGNPVAQGDLETVTFHKTP